MKDGLCILFLVPVAIVAGDAMAKNLSSLGTEYLGIRLGDPTLSVPARYGKVRRQELKQNAELYEACDRSRAVLFRFLGEPYTKGSIKSISARRDFRGACRDRRMPLIDADPRFPSSQDDFVQLYGEPKETRAVSADERALLYRVHADGGASAVWVLEIKGDGVVGISLRIDS
jgi:hypothetical protein